MVDIVRETGRRQSDRVRPFVAAVLDVGSWTIGSALADATLVVYVIGVVITVGLLTGTLRGVRAVGYVWLGLLVVGGAVQFIPPFEPMRVVVAVLDGIAAWLVVLALRGGLSRSESPPR
jgi:hypothetical protein